MVFSEQAKAFIRGTAQQRSNLLLRSSCESTYIAACLVVLVAQQSFHRYNLVAELDPSNSGVLIVSIDGRDRGTGRVMRPDDLARGIEQQNEGCLIM